MDITLYSFWNYDRSAKVRWLFEELKQNGVKLDYREHRINREAKENEQEPYLSLNPMGRSPTLVIDGNSMIESNGICAYFADRFMDGKMAPPLHANERAEYQQWMAFASSTFEDFIVRIMIIEDIPPGEVFDKKSASLLSDVRDAAELLQKTLTHHDYLVSSGFSAADICLGYHLYIAMMWPEFESIFNEFPKIKPYLERLKKRPAAEKAQAFSYPS